MSLLFFSLIFTLWSVGTAKSSIRQILFFFSTMFLYWFWSSVQESVIGLYLKIPDNFIHFILHDGSLFVYLLLLEVVLVFFSLKIFRITVIWWSQNNLSLNNLPTRAVCANLCMRLIFPLYSQRESPKHISEDAKVDTPSPKNPSTNAVGLFRIEVQILITRSSKQASIAQSRIFGGSRNRAVAQTRMASTKIHRAFVGIPLRKGASGARRLT